MIIMRRPYRIRGGHSEPPSPDVWRRAREISLFHDLGAKLPMGRSYGSWKGSIKVGTALRVGPYLIEYSRKNDIPVLSVSRDVISLAKKQIHRKWGQEIDVNDYGPFGSKRIEIMTCDTREESISVLIKITSI